MQRRAPVLLAPAAVYFFHDLQILIKKGNYSYFHQKISAKGRNFLQFYYKVVYKFITSAC